MLSSQTPHDVDIDELHQHSAAERLLEMFDEFSWRTFVSLIWPVSATGEAASSIMQPLGNGGVPRWRTFRSGQELSPPHGLAPLPWWSGRDSEGIPRRNVHVSSARFRYLPTSVQADGKPLWDQNGHPVLYETLVDRALFDYVRRHRLYCLDGQAAFAAKPVYMPPGLHWDKNPSDGGQVEDVHPDHAGAIALKLAWKILAGFDDPGRFYSEVIPLIAENGCIERVPVGLVGMHVAHKTQSSASWVWSTFEHVDALSSYDALTGAAPRPLFVNPASACPPNTDSEPDEDGKRRTQVERTVPVAGGTEALNQRYRAALAAQGSIFRHYRLLGTQRMVRTANRRESQPVPLHLANPLFETRVPKERASALCAHQTARLATDTAAHADFVFLLRNAVHAWPCVATVFRMSLPGGEGDVSATGCSIDAPPVLKAGLAEYGRHLSAQARVECVVRNAEWLLLDGDRLWCLRRRSSDALDVFEHVRGGGEDEVHCQHAAARASAMAQ